MTTTTTTMTFTAARNSTLMRPSRSNTFDTVATSSFDSTTLTALQSDPYKVLVVAPARIYHAQLGKHSEWTYSRLKGSLVFGMNTPPPAVDQQRKPRDAAADGYWFRLIDEDLGKVVWMFEIPSGAFGYQIDRPFFHVFQGRSRKFGFLFDDDEKAVALAKEVMSRTSPTPRPTPFIPRTIRRKPSCPTINTTMISSPTPNSFLHVSHVGVNKDGLFEASEDLDPTWEHILTNLQGHSIVHNQPTSTFRGKIWKAAIDMGRSKSTSGLSKSPETTTSPATSEPEFRQPPNAPKPQIRLVS